MGSIGCWRNSRYWSSIVICALPLGPWDLPYRSSIHTTHPSHTSPQLHPYLLSSLGSSVELSTAPIDLLLFSLGLWYTRSRYSDRSSSTSPNQFSWLYKSVRSSALLSGSMLLTLALSWSSSLMQLSGLTSARHLLFFFQSEIFLSKSSVLSCFWMHYFSPNI